MCLGDSGRAEGLGQRCCWEKTQAWEMKKKEKGIDPDLIKCYILLAGKHLVCSEVLVFKK